MTLEENNCCVIEQGRLVIPLNEFAALDGKVTCFIPSAGSDDDLRDLFAPINVTEIFPVGAFPNKLVPLTGGRLPGIQIDTKYEFFNAPKGELSVGDVITYCCDERYVVDSVSEDAFKPWMDVVSIGKKNRFKRNNSRRLLQFRKIPKIIGKIIHIDAHFLGTYNSVNIEFHSQKKYNHGTFSASYKNAIINEEGYLIHDVAIVVE